MVASVASLGDGVIMTSKTSLSREIEVWEQQKFDLEMRNLEFDEATQDRQSILIGRRTIELEYEIKYGKRQCNSVDRSQTLERAYLCLILFFCDFCFTLTWNYYFVCESLFNKVFI